MTDSRSLPIPNDWREPIEQYLRYSRSLGKREESLRTYRERLSTLARGLESGPYEVTYNEIMVFLADRVWALATRRAHLQTWRGFWRWAVLFGHAKIDPTARVPKLKVPRPMPQPIPYPLYLEALLRADPRTRMILRLAGELGLRRGEIAVVNTATDLLETSHGWSLRVHGKGGYRRTLPLTQELYNLLTREEPGYLLPGKISGHLSPRRVYELAAKYLPASWSIHKLRHMFASRTYAISRDLAAVQELLGHASPTTKDYVAVDDAHLRELVESVAARSLTPEIEARVLDLEEQLITIDFRNLTPERATEVIGLLGMHMRTRRHLSGSVAWDCCTSR